MHNPHGEHHTKKAFLHKHALTGFTTHAYSFKPVEASHAPSPKYIYSVLRAYTDAILENGEEDLSDLLFQKFGEMTLRMSDTAGFLSYDLRASGSDRFHTVAIYIQPQHNEVGMRMWEAGYLLTEYVLARPKLFRDKRIVELGAGLGLTGIAASMCAGARRVVLTDCQTVVLENLQFIAD